MTPLIDTKALAKAAAPPTALPLPAEPAPRDGRRKRLAAFLADRESEEAVRAGLRDAVGADMLIRRGDVRAAMAELARLPTPANLIVDVSGHPQPLAALEDLAQLVEPDVQVLVVGDRDDVGFYRQLTRGLGVAEYLFKPLTPTMVGETFGPLITGRGGADYATRGGRVVAICGARGGVGTTTVSVALSWYLAEAAKRHTVLVDADLTGGTCALLLGLKPSNGLRAVLDSPERIDEMLIERTAQRLGERLHVLESLEPLGEWAAPPPGTAEVLLHTLRRRYNFIVIDLPGLASPLHRDLFERAHQRVVVLDPSLAALRDALRLTRLPPGPNQARRPVLVLNRANRAGGLARRQLVEALEAEPEVVIEDLPKRVDRAALLGQPQHLARGPLWRAVARLAREIGAQSRPPAGRGPLARLGGLFRG